MPDTLTVVARIIATKGQADALARSMTQMVQDTRAEEGCIKYVLTRSVDDANVFVFIEEWQSHALWQAHMNGAAIAAHRARTGEGMVASAEVHALTVVA